MENQYQGISEEEITASDFEFESELEGVGLSEEQYAEAIRGVDHLRSLIFHNFDFSDQEQMQSALLEMLKYHKGQEARTDGRPYITHPIEVSRMVLEDFGIVDKDLCIVALLHDSIEDQALKIAQGELTKKYGSDSLNNPEFLEQNKAEIRETALEKIEKQYGGNVASLLRKLSNPDFTQMASREVDPEDKEALQARKNELYKEHVRKEIEDPSTLVVKLADFMQNTSEASVMPETPKKKKHRGKYVPVIDVFIERLQNDNLECPIKDTESVIARLRSIKEILGNELPNTEN